jgi:serine/threonine-protein kinase HipA
MAIRSTNAHWRMKEIQRRHWLALGTRFGVLEDDGRDIEAIVDDLIDRTSSVIAHVEAGLPPGFPDAVASPVLRGLERAARQLAMRTDG